MAFHLEDSMASTIDRVRYIVKLENTMNRPCNFKSTNTLSYLEVSASIPFLS